MCFHKTSLFPYINNSTDFTLVTDYQKVKQRYQAVFIHVSIMQKRTGEC